MPPRVLFVNHTSTIAGAEFILLDVVRPWVEASAFLFEDGPLNPALEQRGLNVSTSRWARGLSVIRRDRSLWQAAPLIGRLGAITLEMAVAARRHDLIYANSQKAFVLSAFAAAIARRPLVWHLHDIIDDSHFGAAQRRLQVRLANRVAARVVVPSEVAAAAFVSAGGRRDLVEVIPNGVEIVRDDRPRAVLRKELGLPEGRLAGVFSRLAPWKGQHVVLRALAKLPGVRCVFAGAALFGEQSYAESLKKLVAELGLGDRVYFVGQRDDVPRLMRAVDVMIHPSVNPEPFGRTLVEAMLAEVPVVATNTGASPLILECGAAGTLVPPNDADALAAAVDCILKRPHELAEQLRYAEARARTQFGVDAMTHAISDVIDRAAA